MRHSGSNRRHSGRSCRERTSSQQSLNSPLPTSDRRRSSHFASLNISAERRLSFHPLSMEKTDTEGDNDSLDIQEDPNFSPVKLPPPSGRNSRKGRKKSLKATAALARSVVRMTAAASQRRSSGIRISSPSKSPGLSSCPKSPLFFEPEVDPTSAKRNCVSSKVSNDMELTLPGECPSAVEDGIPAMRVFVRIKPLDREIDGTKRHGMRGGVLTYPTEDDFTGDFAGKTSVQDSTGRKRVAISMEPGDKGGSDTKVFTLDGIFDRSTTQEEVYNVAAQPIVNSVLQGFNGTILAYGQTSSGKTHTMEGPPDIRVAKPREPTPQPGFLLRPPPPVLSSMDSSNASMQHSEDERGIIPRAVTTIFDFVESRKNSPSGIQTDFRVSLSVLEIYMEKVRDLLSPATKKPKNLKIREDRVKGVFVEGLTEIEVSTAEELFDCLAHGQANRVVADTLMNQFSSRSHLVCTISVAQKNVLNLSQKVGKLHLVDLAGSEKVSKTQVEGLSLDEAKTINKSLACLGNVIHALTDSSKTKEKNWRGHVPYRDSKLTRILQESLGGNSKTSLICTVSASSSERGETLSTLRFGQRAKRVKNKPVINQEKTVQQMEFLLAMSKRRIAHLKRYVGVLEGALTAANVDIERLRDAANYTEESPTSETPLDRQRHSDELDNILPRSLSDLKKQRASDDEEEISGENSLRRRFRQKRSRTGPNLGRFLESDNDGGSESSSTSLSVQSQRPEKDPSKTTKDSIFKNSYFGISKLPPCVLLSEHPFVQTFSSHSLRSTGCQTLSARQINASQTDGEEMNPKADEAPSDREILNENKGSKLAYRKWIFTEFANLNAKLRQHMEASLYLYYLCASCSSSCNALRARLLAASSRRRLEHVHAQRLIRHIKSEQGFFFSNATERLLYFLPCLHSLSGETQQPISSEGYSSADPPMKHNMYQIILSESDPNRRRRSSILFPPSLPLLNPATQSLLDVFKPGLLDFDFYPLQSGQLRAVRAFLPQVGIRRLSLHMDQVCKIPYASNERSHRLSSHFLSPREIELRNKGMEEEVDIPEALFSVPGSNLLFSFYTELGLSSSQLPTSRDRVESVRLPEETAMTNKVKQFRKNQSACYDTIDLSGSFFRKRRHSSPFSFSIHRSIGEDEDDQKDTLDPCQRTHLQLQAIYHLQDRPPTATSNLRHSQNSRFDNQSGGNTRSSPLGLFGRAAGPVAESSNAWFTGRNERGGWWDRFFSSSSFSDMEDDETPLLFPQTTALT